jgi:parallel beta-helix repeat protein
MNNTRLTGLLVFIFVLIAAGAEAQCPGSCPTADDIAVQQQLDAAAAAGGGIVQLEARLYLICSPLIIGSNTHLRGAGRGATIIRGTPSANGVVVNNSYVSASIGTAGTTNVTVSDLTVDHATCERNANGVAFLPSTLPGSGSETYDGTVPTNGLIERVEVRGSPSFHSYMIWNLKGHHMKILNNWVDGGASEESFQEGIETLGGHDVLIAGNTVKNIGYACLNVGSTGLLESGTVAVTLANNYLTNCTVGIHLGTSFESAPQSQLNTRVLGNVIVGMRETGIDVAVVPDTVERDLTISSNTIRDISANQAAGILLRSNGGTLSNEAVIANTITDNHIDNIRGTNSHGIRLVQYHNVRMTGNTITGSDHGGIYIADSNDLEIVGNRLEGSGLAPIQLWGTTPAGVERFLIERNFIRDWPGLSAGILVVTGKLGTIKDNVFKRADSAKPNPITVTTQSCGVQVNRNVPWYYMNWPGTVVPDCP